MKKRKKIIHVNNVKTMYKNVKTWKNAKKKMLNHEKIKEIA